jgi:hypothetical protein
MQCSLFLQLSLLKRVGKHRPIPIYSTPQSARILRFTVTLTILGSNSNFEGLMNILHEPPVDEWTGI